MLRDIIVIAGSAGSIQALKHIVSYFPADLPAAVFVVVHVPPWHDSNLTFAKNGSDALKLEFRRELWLCMVTILLCLFRFIRLLASGHQAVAVENLALRLQLAAFQRKRKRPILTQLDRLFWVSLSQVWSGWRRALVFIQPDTVVRWQRERFRRFWAEQPKGDAMKTFFIDSDDNISVFASAEETTEAPGLERFDSVDQFLTLAERWSGESGSAATALSRNAREVS